jgi:hypothetical protein
MADCFTIRLTSEQQEQLQRLTGYDAKALVIPTEMLEDIIADDDDMPVGDYEEFVWECLNPYP